MYGYCLVCRKKIEFTPTTVKQNKNGTYTAMGTHGNTGHKISRIISKDDAMKLKK